MSFGGGGQGQVRYALLLDDQASTKLKTFNQTLASSSGPVRQMTTQVQQMQTQVTQTATKFTTFNTAINNNAKSFTASLTPIKQQGSALTSLQTNLAANSTTATTLGKKIKDTTTRFSGLAVGLSATATGALQLGAGFRDYSDATIAVERQTRKLSLAHEAVNKAQDKLNALATKGIKSGKEYAQAQLDLSQANQNLSVQTQLLGEKQEDLFDSQTQFATSVIPTVLGAVGTLGMAFKSLGGEKGMGGLVEKFKGLGGSVGGIGGIFDKLQTSITGSSGSIKSMAGTVGVLALAAGGAVAIYEEFNAVIKDHKAVADGSLRPTQALTNELDRMSKLDFSTIQSSIATIAKFTGPGPGFANLLKPFAEEADKASQGLDKLSVSLKTIPPSMNGAATSTNAMVNRLIVLETNFKSGKISSTEYAKGIFEIQQKLGTEGFGKAQDEANKLIANYTTVTKAAIPPTQQLVSLTQQELNVISRRNEAMANAAQQDIDVAAALGEVITNTTKAAGESKVLADRQQIYNDVNLKTIPQDLKLAEGLANTAKIMKTVGDTTKLATGKGTAWLGQVDKSAAAQIKLNAILDQAKDKFKTFIDSTNDAAQINKIYTDSLLKTVSAQIQIPAGLKLTTSQLEALETALIKSKVDMAGMSEATKILADAFNEQLAPAMKTFNSAITADKFKEFKKAFKDMPGFGDFTSKARSELMGLVGDFRKVAKAAQEVGTDISAAVLGAFEGLSSKSLGSFVKELNKDIKSIAKIDIDATKFKPITDFLNNLTDKNRAAGILKIKDSLALMQDAMADGNITAAESAAIMAKFAENTGTTVDPVNKSAAAIKAFGVSSASARGQIDEVTGAVDVLKNAVQTAHLELPAPDPKPFAQGLNSAITAAVSTAKAITKALTKTEINAPDPKPFAQGLNNALKTSSKTASAITKALAKTEIGAPNPKPFAQGLNSALNAASKTASAITKTLAKTKVGAPDLSDFGHGLNEAINAAGDAARRINAKLSSVKIPQSSGGIWSFAKGGIVSAAMGNISTVHGPTRVGPFLAGDNPGGSETVAFIPKNNPMPTLEKLFAMYFGGGKGGGGGNGTSQGNNNNIYVEIHEHKDGREEIRKYKAAAGRDRYVFGT